MLYFVLRLIFAPIISIFWIGKVEGKRNIPEIGGVIIAPNHQSWLDFCFLATVLSRRLFFLVAAVYYKNPFYRFILHYTSNVKVDLAKSDRSCIYKQAKEILSGGNALVIFPEGWRTFDGKIRRAYLGVARIALESKVDIIPTVIESYHIFPRSKKFPKMLNVRCRILFLEPLKYYKFKDKSPEHIVHELLMPKIAAELGHEYPKTEEALA